MKKTLKLFLIRHAPVKNIVGYVPEHDPNAIINSNHLKNLSFHIPKRCACYVSPLKRAIQTANALDKYLKFKELIIEENLKEQSFGSWSGKKISDVWNDLKELKEQHNFSFISPETLPPKGDSFLEQYKRISTFMNNLSFNNQNSLIIIAHSGTIRAFLAYMLNIDLNKTIGIEISHLSITSFEVLKKLRPNSKGGKFRLLSVNQKVM